MHANGGWSTLDRLMQTLLKNAAVMVTMMRIWRSTSSASFVKVESSGVRRRRGCKRSGGVVVVV
jgi:hypothetical protein